MIMIKNREGKKILEIPDNQFPLYFEFENSKLKKIYKLLLTGAKKLLLN